MKKARKKGFQSRIALASGRTVHQPGTQLCDGLSVTRSINARGWQVNHDPTGCHIPFWFRTKAAAVDAAAWLCRRRINWATLTLDDWRKMPASRLSRWCKVLRRIGDESYK